MFTRFVDFGMRVLSRRTGVTDVRLVGDRGPLRELHWDRTAPAHVARGLAQLDPRAVLLYAGWGRWRLMLAGESLPTRDIGARLATAERLLAEWDTVARVRANPGAKRRLLARHEFWIMVSRGYRPVAEYRYEPGEPYIAKPGEPTSAIVDDFERMGWMQAHYSEQDTLTALNAEKDAAQAAAHADLVSPERGREAWRYLFVRTHGWEAPNVQRVRSGFTRQVPVPSSPSLT